VAAARFSLDGKWIVTTGDGQSYSFAKGGFASQTLRGDNVFGQVWDRAIGAEVAVLKWPDPSTVSYVNGIALSPDGKYLLTAGFNQFTGRTEDHCPHVWEIPSGRRVASLAGHEANWVAFHGGAFSPDSRRVVTVANDRTARIWEAASGKELASLRGHRQPVRAVAFSPDGRRLVTASDDHTARVWDAATGEEAKEREVVLGPFHRLTLSADGRCLLGTQDTRYQRTNGGVCLWDSRTAQRTPFEGPADLYSFGALSADGRKILACTQNNGVCLWDARTRKLVATLKPVPHQVTAVPEEVPNPADKGPKPHTKPPAFPPTAVKRRPLTLAERLVQADNAFSYGCFSSDGRRVFTANGNGYVWDAVTGKELAFLPGVRDFPIQSGSFSPDGKRVVTLTSGPLGGTSSPVLARVWDAASGELLLTLGKQRDLTEVVFRVDKATDKTEVLDRITGEVVRDFKPITHGMCTFAVFSPDPDGRHLLTDAFDQDPRVWDSRTGKELLSLKGHVARARSAAYSADGARIVTASADRTARLWDAATGRQLAVLRGHDAELVTAVLSPDGRLVLTASYDRTARLWDATTGKELATYRGHEHMVDNAIFLGDGRRIVTISTAKARVWPIDLLAAAKARRPRELTAEEREQFGITKPARE
jgi:WD40 repeat protein